MSRFFVSILFILSVPVSTLTAQTNDNQLINSGKLLEDGQKLYEDGKYKEAIQVYSQISRNDTNYADALHNLALSTYGDSDYDASRKYAELGLKLFPDEAYDWYNLIGNTCEAKGKSEDAIGYYDKIIALNANSYISWFNKGISFYDQQKYPAAKKCFQRVLIINPYYSSAHYFLAKSYLLEGNLPAAMMGYATYLALSPDGSRKSGAVNALSEIAHLSDSVEAKAANMHFTRTDNFEMQQEILSSKIALDKQYKLQTDLEDPITRQLQVLCEKLEYNKSDTGFCMQYYVPFYRSVFQQGKFSQMVYFMFSGFDIKQVQDFAKRHKKDLEDFAVFEVNYYNTIKEAQQLDVQARQAATVHYLVENDVVTGKGAWREVGNNKTFYGPWEFYYSNGQVKSKGNFNDQEKKEGEWFFYYKSGQLKEQSIFSNDEANGKSTHWFDNGNLSYEVTYMNDKEDGEEKTYFYNGLPHEVLQFKDGKKEGLVRGYKSTGELSYDAYFKNDVQDGSEIYYYPDGKILSQAEYKEGKVDGLYKKFAENGTAITQGAYVNDKAEGQWKSWYPSGKIKEEYTCQNGNIMGEYKYYFENGQVSQHNNYLDGKEDGKQEYFTGEGKLLNESTFEKGRLREIKFFDEKGNVLADNTTRNGAGAFTFYNAYGRPVSQGNFNKDGEKDGSGKDFYQDGVVSTIAEYKKGLLNGVKTNYFHNGNVNDNLSYTDDKEDGYYTSFHKNKNRRYEGWFVSGERQGAFIEYNLLGDLYAKSYYKNNELSGYVEYYNPNGRKDYENLYDEGWMTRITQFDSTGKVVEDVALPKGQCDFTYYYNNGKPYIKASYRNYHLHGRYDAFYPDGSPCYVRFYKQGMQDSTYKKYYYGGKVESEGKFVNDKKQGLWKTYYSNGQLHYDETYVDDELQGKSLFYNEDGTKNKEYFYKDNQLDGKTTIYGDSNKVAIIFYYHEGRLLSYSYEGKDGKLVPAIPFGNETGTATAYYRNGVKSALMSFVNGYADSIRTVYFSNGKVYMQGMRSYGDYEGVHKRYAANGQLVAEENYANDNLHGVCKYYYVNGKIKAEENYYNGSENGSCKYYDETGKLKQTLVYYYGQLESVQ